MELVGDQKSPEDDQPDPGDDVHQPQTPAHPWPSPPSGARRPARWL